MRLQLFDTSVLIPTIREAAYEDLLRQALRAGRARISSVVMQELYAGARTPADKKSCDGINRAFMSRGYMVTPDHEDWTLGGITLARYQQLHGGVEPRDHINDILIALCAAKVNAELVTENAADKDRWRRMLRRSGKVLHVLAVKREEHRRPFSRR